MKLKTYYFIFVFLFFLFYLGILLAPYLSYLGFKNLSFLLYSLYSPICHQLPERSFFIFNHKMAVCARCFGIYTGALLSLLIYPFLKRLENTNLPRKIYLILALTPMAIDGITQYLGLRESFNLLRFITGFLAGSVTIFYIVPIYIDLIKRLRDIMDKFELEKVKKLAEGKSDTEKMEIYEKFKKSEALAIILSFLFPGLGQLYLGNVGKAVLMIALAIISLILFTICIGFFTYLGVWIWSTFDAYQEAKKYNLELYNVIFEDKGEV
ncbi:DUF2085 domain-containing protein [Methanocaldococcus infernus]